MLIYAGNELTDASANLLASLMMRYSGTLDVVALYGWHLYRFT